MRNVMASVTLKSGETMQIEHVLAPDSERESQIRPFLGHKGPHFGGHITASFEGNCDTLETHYYIGLIGDEMVGNIMTVESNGTGILGHVHTLESHRRKGICSHIMTYQMEDFRARNGRVLLLGTGYQRPPYYIYASFGFRDWGAGYEGRMRYDNPADPDFETTFFAHTPTKVVKAAWGHWPRVAFMAHLPFPDVYLRSVSMEVWGAALLEGGYCRYMVEGANRPDCSAFVLETETGAVAAFATCVPDTRWQRRVNLLDVVYHPNFTKVDLIPLLEALPRTDKPTHCYADPRDREKIAAIETLGFRREAVIPRLFSQSDTYRDGWLFIR